MLLSSHYRYLLSFLLYLSASTVFAAFPIGKEVAFTGGGTNLTFNSEWVGDGFRMKIDSNNVVTGYFDADGLPDRRNILCGTGNFTGIRNGNEIEVTFTSYDPDPGCGFDRGSVFTLIGSLSEDETVFSGKYNISNGQVGVFSFTTVISQSEWGDLKALKDKYDKLKEAKSNEVAFAHQFECISRKSCEDLEGNGSSSWANGFTQHVFQSMETKDGLSDSVNAPCPEYLSNYECFAFKGEVHKEELKHAFASFCKNASYLTLDDDFYRNWDKGHKEFISNAVTPCFREVVGVDELSVLEGLALSIDVEKKANWGREAIQFFICPLPFNPFSSEENSKENGTMRSLTRNFKKEDYFSEIMAEKSELEVILDDGNEFFFNVGTQHKISVRDRNTKEIIPSELITYDMLLGKDLIEFTSKDEFTITRTSEPYVKHAYKVLFSAKTKDKYGIGQFAIIDKDTDGDGLVDSYEKAHGLSIYSKNDGKRDSDRDTLSDTFEAMYGTHPGKKDTDGDGYSDGFEFQMKSKPRDPNCNPITGCTKEATPTEPAQPSESETNTAPSSEISTETESSATEATQGDSSTSSSSGGGGGALLWLSILLFAVLAIRMAWARRSHK